MYSKTQKLFLLLACVLVNTATIAQTVDLPSTFNPVGSGARALGWGGSFIAVADDATAASWNPAALMQLRKPEIALVLSNTSLREKADFSVTQDKASNTTSSSDVNYFAASLPCGSETCGKNMVFSINYQRLYDLSREWDIELNTGATLVNQNYRQDGALYALGLAWAVQLTDNVNIGLTVNIWEDVLGKNGLSRFVDDSEVGIPPDDIFFNTTVSERSDFSGTNFNLGLQWVPYQKGEEKLSVGVVYKSEFDADFDTAAEFRSEFGSLSLPDFTNSISISANRASEITMPASFGVGIGYQPSDNLTTSIDFYYTDWSSFVLTEEDGDQLSVFTNRPISEVDIDSSVQVRVGGEYRFISQSLTTNYVIPVRAGFFYDPIIDDGSNKDGYGVAVGTGVAFENWVFDVAYQYRWADDLGENSLTDLGFGFDIQEHQFFASVFYRM